MRTVWVGTSRKMNKTLGEAVAYARAVAAVEVPDGVRAFVLPPHTALAAVRDALGDSPVLVGAQNAHWAPDGAWTGEVSMRMAADAGAALVELGHSERREHFGETDETVSLKVRAALDAGLTPLVCVGEPATVRDAVAFVVGQVRRGLSRVAAAEVARVLVAYEPVWAIGEHGRPATTAETGPVMAAVAAALAEASGGTGSLGLLYGGSVNAGNAAELLADRHTDGLFAGRSAWTPEGFLELVATAASARPGHAEGPAVSAGPSARPGVRGGT